MRHGVFSADGKILVTVGSDSTALVWDLSGRLLQQRRLARANLEAAWRDLASTDAAKAYQSILSLAADGEASVAFMRQLLRPVVPAYPQKTSSLIAELGSAEFARRQKADMELKQLGFTAEPALRKALADKPTLEVRRRIEHLLQSLEGPETLRIIRAVETLELIGSAEARRHLQTVAQGAPAVRLTKEANASLQRLARRPVQ